MFRVVDAVYLESEDLDTESSTYLKQLHWQFVQNGLKLEKENDRERLKEINMALQELSRKYIRNINQSTTGIWLSEKELEGVPKDHIRRWENAKEGRSGDKLRVNLHIPNFFPVVEYAVRGDVRERIWTTRENNLKDSNGKILKEVILLRDEAARILGFRHHADLKSGERGVKPDEARKFLNGIWDMLTPKGKEEVSQMRRLKLQ